MLSFKNITSPMDQFEVRNLLSLDVPLLGNINMSITNIGLYLIIGVLIVLSLNLFATNNNKIVSNNWSISQESIYATIHSIVVSQINAAKGQIYFPFIYSLFIFILINNLIGLVKRCLSLFINIFIFKINKYLVKLYSTSSSATKYSFNNKNSYYLHPYYITGFIDGEGCFSISMYKDSRMLKGWQVKPVFSINLHSKDRKILEAIQITLGVGKIYKHGKDSIQYRVSSLKNLYVIINHLDKYPLITKKWADYLLFKKSVDLIKNKEHLTLDGLQKIVNIKASLNLGLSEKIKESFPNIIQVERPKVEDTEIKDLNWLRGFTEAEGSFQVVIKKSINKTYISLKFSISQHIRDKILIESFIDYLGCGKIYEPLGRNEIYFHIMTFSDIIEKIIPIFNEYPIIGVKKEDYLDFVKVAELIKSKDHLTKEGIKKIEKIINNMNSKRIQE